MKWILIIWLGSAFSPQPVPVAQFETEKQCIKALEQWNGSWKNSYPGRCIYGEPIK
jgi:hypothetical protein